MSQSLSDSSETSSLEFEDLLPATFSAPSSKKLHNVFHVPRLIKESAKKKSRNKLIFGASLETAVQLSQLSDNIQLPCVFRYCIQHMEMYGLLHYGIYKYHGNKSVIYTYKQYFDQLDDVVFDSDDHINVAALLKLYLRSLPERILTKELSLIFDHACSISYDKMKFSTIRSLLKRLPNQNFLILSWTIVHIGNVIRNGESNGATLENMVGVFSDVLHIGTKLLHLLLKFYKIFFKKSTIVLFDKLSTRYEFSKSLQNMSDVQDLTFMLQERENQLVELRDYLSKNENQTKSDQIWSLQREATDIKQRITELEKQIEIKNQESSNFCSNCNQLKFSNAYIVLSNSHLKSFEQKLKIYPKLDECSIENERLINLVAELKKSLDVKHVQIKSLKEKIAVLTLKKKTLPKKKILKIELNRMIEKNQQLKKQNINLKVLNFKIIDLLNKKLADYTESGQPYSYGNFTNYQNSVSNYHPKNALIVVAKCNEFNIKFTILNS
ncbi:hypothetical protein A3Q56_06849 [Intoshia linei]|uniref:Rho-GAP domain-containing protein n=1 Tax=Intoshia linei TaxID=1819745 RepID=A0A177AUC8_9BILA|nr:hypothetical protein A3Q56_06849 [Intoshia linei]